MVKKTIKPSINQKKIGDFFITQNVSTVESISQTSLSSQFNNIALISASVSSPDSIDSRDSGELITTSSHAIDTALVFQIDPAVGNLLIYLRLIFNTRLIAYIKGNNLFEYNTERIMPIINFPKNSAGRRFSSKWYETYDFLEYSILTDKAFCRSCRLFGNINRALIWGKNGFNDWAHPGRIDNHKSSDSHIEADLKLKGKILLVDGYRKMFLR
jgi:hypothetical protein